MNDRLAALAEELGVLVGFHDIGGQWRPLSQDAARRLVGALGWDASDDEAAGRSLEQLRQERRARPAPAQWIGEEGRALSVPVASPVAWCLRTAGDGALLGEGEARESVELAPLAPGRYWLELRCAAGAHRTLLLVRPAQVPMDRLLAGGKRCWGLMAALYGLRSRRDSGIGDYGDLALLAETAGRAGADFLGINPVHALPQSDPLCPSPYSPDHRGFLNTRHLALDQVPEFAASAEARRRYAWKLAEIRALRDAELVDYDRVAAVQGPILEALFAAFRARPEGDARRRAFAAWRHERGAALEHFATYQALGETFGPDSGAWPESCRRGDGPGLAGFRREHAQRLEYHAYLQFLAEEQLRSAGRAARAAGMELGLYLDLAVGTGRCSAEVWAEPEVFAPGVSLGAPPDQFNPAGQGWGLAPLHPQRLVDRAYEPLIAVLRLAMRAAGAVRVDHIIGFQQSFWIPDGMAEGGYVRFPREGLLAVLAIEAAAAGAVIVGEDLGVVPPDLRERLAQDRIAGCAVMQFERYGEGFRAPADYRELSIASFGSHDLPTIRGWWRAEDVAVLLAAQQITSEEAERMRQERAVARRGLWEILGRHGLLEPDHDPRTPPEHLDSERVLAVHRLLAGGRSVLVGLALDDVLGVVEQQNLPGTVEGHPNWRRRLPVTLERLGECPSWGATCEALAALRGKPHGR